MFSYAWLQLWQSKARGWNKLKACFFTCLVVDADCWLGLFLGLLTGIVMYFPCDLGFPSTWCLQFPGQGGSKRKGEGRRGGEGREEEERREKGEEKLERGREREGKERKECGIWLSSTGPHSLILGSQQHLFYHFLFIRIMSH